MQAGGWFNFALFDYTDPEDRRRRTQRLFTLRGWASLNVQGVHQAYFRGLLGWEDWNSGDNPKLRGDEDIDPVVERAWYQLDLAQLHRNRTGREPPVALKIKVGRAYTQIGTALTLSVPMDMIQFDVSTGAWDVMALLGRTVSRTPNIDPSEPVATRLRRSIWGVEVAYNGLARHRPFVYFLSNSDDPKPRPRDPNQSFGYDSHYVGLGSTGSVLDPNLHYQCELVGEWGKTYSDGVTAGRDPIQAFAADFLVEYYFRRPGRPRVQAEYLFASGDSDRRVSATSTIGGNRAGTVDHAFNAFGFRDTGLAFAPRISNLQMFMVGGSFFPFENHRWFRKMEVGTKAFFYQKAKSGGPISVISAGKDSRYLGMEWDVFCDWRITSDVAFTIRYGAFGPGGAFSDQSCVQFFYTGVTFSF